MGWKIFFFRRSKERIVYFNSLLVRYSEPLLFAQMLPLRLITAHTHIESMILRPYWGGRGAACTGPGYSTMAWSEALEPSGSVTWRPGLIRDHATTPYEVRSKTMLSWVPYISYKPPIFGVHPRSAGPRNRQSAQNRLAGIRGILMRCRGTHGDQLRRLP